MSKSTKPTYREVAKDLRKLRSRSKVGHQQTLMIAILELEKLARAEEERELISLAKANHCKCRCHK